MNIGALGLYSVMRVPDTPTSDLNLSALGIQRLRKLFNYPNICPVPVITRKHGDHQWSSFTCPINITFNT